MIMCRSERLPRVLSINANTMAGLLFRAMLALVCQGIGQSGQTIAPQPRRASRASVAIRSTGIFYPIRGAIARPRRKVASRLGAFIAGSDHLGDPRRHVGLIVAHTRCCGARARTRPSSSSMARVILVTGTLAIASPLPSCLDLGGNRLAPRFQPLRRIFIIAQMIAWRATPAAHFWWVEGSQQNASIGCGRTCHVAASQRHGHRVHQR